MLNKIIIFDFDGTIADTFHAIVDIGNILSDEFKYNKIREEDIDALKNKSVLEAVKFLGVNPLTIPMILARSHEELHKRIDSIEPIEGLKEVIFELKNLGYHIGILTTNSTKNVIKFLENNQLNIFDFITSTSKIFGKNYGLKNIAKKNKFPLKDILYIGDEIRDVQAAKKAGIQVAAVTWGYNSKKSLQASNPDYLINFPADLIKII